MRSVHACASNDRQRPGRQQQRVVAVDMKHTAPSLSLVSG